jgi:hypothetical protein
VNAGEVWTGSVAGGCVEGILSDAQSAELRSKAMTAIHPGAATAPHPAEPVVTPGPERRGPSAGVVGLTVNDVVHTVDLEPRVSLLDALREHLGLTGAKKYPHPPLTGEPLEFSMASEESDGGHTYLTRLSLPCHPPPGTVYRLVRAPALLAGHRQDRAGLREL